MKVRLARVSATSVAQKEKLTPGFVVFADVHTLLGNAHGMPCSLPFKYNNKWYSECTTEGREDHLPWCSTTTRYDEAEKWGFCPVHGKEDTARNELEWTDYCAHTSFITSQSFFNSDSHL